MTTLVTVTYGTWHTYTARLIRMVEAYTRSGNISEWIICDNNSGDIEHLNKCGFSLPVRLIAADENINDIPRYNRIMETVEDDFVIFLSTDMRLFGPGWVQEFLKSFQQSDVGIVGAPGPGGNMTKEHADPAVGREWHWIPKLLVDRDIPFDICAHVQTHCFAVRTEAFRDAGGFWVPEGEYGVKGHMIAGEISLSVRMRGCGWRLNHSPPRMHHYGNAAKSCAELDNFDRSRGWRIDF